MLRVWAKNQLRFEIFEKILKFRHQNLNGKLTFYPFSLPSSRTFVILCTSATYQNGGGGFINPCLFTIPILKLISGDMDINLHIFAFLANSKCLAYFEVWSHNLLLTCMHTHLSTCNLFLN